VETTTATFINPSSQFLVDDQVMPPLGIMYLSSWLKFNLVDSNIVDLADEDVRNRFNNGDVPNTTHYFFTATTPQYTDVLKCMKWIKDMFPDAITVIGGAHATFRSKECRFDGFDYVVVGEGECAALRIMQNDFNDDERATGVVVGETIKDLDYITFPDRRFDGFDNYDYTIDGKKATTMFTTRGCPFHCSFCAKMFDGVRMRSADSVLREVEYLKDEFGFGGMMFFDDTFTVNKRRLRLICKGLKKLHMKWRCFIHAETVDVDVLKMMKDSGCCEVGMGVESGNEKILETINKHTSIDTIKKVIKICHDINLRVKTFLIAGLPGETFFSMLDTQQFLLQTKPDDFDLTMFIPYPGNDIWNNPDNYDITFDKECGTFEDMFYKGRDGEYIPMISTKHLTGAEIARLRDQIVKRVRSELYGT
jgi:radical SAM superfamily enzyme YgiQ (UPF0313 family)